LLGVAVALAFAATWWLARDLAPPKTLTFAAGSEGGGYWTLAQAYKRILARDGIELRVRATAGSVENAALLADGSVDVALMQGGIATEAGLMALGAVFLEPVLLFARTEAMPPPNIGTWDGQRLAAGGEGSGTRAAVDALLGAAQIASAQIVLDPRGGAAAAQALSAGEVDAAVFVAPVSAPYLMPLFSSAEVALVQKTHITALSRRLAQSRVIVLPSGALTLDPPKPERPLSLLAMVASLVGQPDLHPSLVDRLVEAAREVHGRGTVLAPAGTFPNVDGLVLPMSAQARDLITEGPSPLQAYLPYWVVAQIDRFAILIVPFLLILLPLFRVLPALYAWQMRHRVVRHYTEIREIEEEAREAAPDRLEVLQASLARIDSELAELWLPLHYRQTAYTARVHIDLLQNKISERLTERRS